MSETWDQSKFNAVLADYMRVTKRTVAEVMNTKAMFVGRNAVLMTHKAPRQKIESSLGKHVTVERTTRKGAVRRSRRIDYVQADSHPAPLLALIINARARRNKQPGLQGAAMRRKMKSVLGARFRSIGFIRASWLPAIKAMREAGAKSAGAPPSDSSVRQFGIPKGAGYPAKDNSEQPFAVIENRATGSKESGRSALLNVGSRGLDQAFAKEADSMERYILDKLGIDAAKANGLLAG